jgi:PhnB protein
MAERALADRVNEVIDVLLARGNATAALADQELAPLAVLAAGLRDDCPGQGFKERLRAQLTRRGTMAAQTATASGSATVREGFTTVTPYLRVPEAGLVHFLAQAFGAEETFSAQGGGGGTHREVRVGSSMLMIGEGAEGGLMPVRPAAFHVYVPDVDAAFQRALAAGGESLGDPADRPYGERAGFVKDRFGNHWYIATSLGPTPVPEGLRTVTPYLHPAGVPAFIDFAKQAFGAVEQARHTGPDGRVMHAEVRIGDAALQMGEGEANTPMPGSFYLYVPDVDASYRQATDAGARSLQTPTVQPYGERVGAVEDRFGNQWWLGQPL